MSIFKTTGWIGIFVVVALLGFISCDLGNNDSQEDVVDEITFIPMISSNEMAKRASSPPSPYGCVLSTLNLEGSEHLYRYQGFFIKFPPEVHRQARGKTVNRGFHYSSSEVSERTPNFLNEEGTVRFVNCKIPDSDLAIEMLEEEFSKFDSNSWALDSSQKGKINAIESEDFNQSSLGEGEWWYECTLTWNHSISIHDPVTDEMLYILHFYDVDCCWVYYEDEGTVGGDSGGGDDPNPPCDNEMDLCFEEPGGGTPVPPPPTDPCDADNPPVACLNPCQTGDPDIDDFKTQLMFEDIWKASRVGTKNSASDQAQRLENGLVVEPLGSGYYHLLVPKDLPSSISVTQTNLRLSWNYTQNWKNHLPEGTFYVHTHPYYVGEIVYDNFNRPHVSGRSEDDVDALKELGLSKGITIDADNIFVFDDNGNTIAEYKRCGY